MARLTHDTRGFGCVGRYVQGYGEIHNLTKYLAEYGNLGYILIDEALYEELKAFLSKEEGFSFRFGMFSGEVTPKFMQDAAADASGAQFVVGIGGGKTVDAAKGIADICKVPVILVPTIASTDAPVASMTAVFNDEGEQTGIMLFKTCPSLVLVDSEIITKAPVRYFSAGIGDALATAYEARASASFDNPNFIAGGLRSTIAGMAIANACETVIREKAVSAMKAVELGLCTPDVEDVIEANTLLSGLGFLNVGLGGAHATNTGLTQLPETKGMLHGELVAFGIVVQFIVEQLPKEEVEDLLAFLTKVRLPITFAELGIEKMTDEMLMKVAKKACSGFWTRSPRVVNERMISDAILMADALGREYQKTH